EAAVDVETLDALASLVSGDALNAALRQIAASVTMSLLACDIERAGTRISEGSFPVPHMVLKSTSAQDPNQNPVFEQVTGIDLGGDTTTGGVPNPGGLMGQVWVDVDRSDGPTRGNVYVLASIDPPGDDPMDVMFVRSLDGGATFSPPERVNHDPASNGAWQWFGTMSVAPNGRIDAIWNDTSDDGSAITSAVYYAYSTSAGAKWSDGLKVTPEFNSLQGHPNQNKIGDYYQMVSDNVGGALAFSATFNGEQDLYFLRVGDCNGNGVHDSEDIVADGTLDCSRNGVIDTCEGFECPPCDFDSQCSDGRFCNGVETCEASLCRPGPPPDCSDGDSCTQDTCNVETDACENPPVLVPAGTENVNLTKGTPDPDVAVLGWDIVPGADMYNLYRGVQQDLTDQSCLTAGITGTSSPDDGQLPLAGEVFFYGVTSENCAGESTLGDDRVIAAPCP
ncbi:MAG: sialidase family protein, partial [Acidobacteriota bacterium]|nr:sialidase family protein [Acidobacteriota bacterium]